VCLAILLEFWPVAHPILQLRVPEIYSALSNLESGALLELPLGVRDGFGAQGRLDHEALFHQTIHGRPIFGGFVARLSPRVRVLYSTEPVLSSLLTLSSGKTLTAADLARDRALAADRLHRWRVRAVVVRKEEASAELVRYVREILGVRLIAEDETRQVYVVGATDFHR
jgi:hypothetical protein